MNSITTDTICRVRSSELVTLGLRPGDPFRILPMPFELLFNGDLVVAVANGFRCIGQLQPGRHHHEVKIAVPLPSEPGQPPRFRVAFTDPASVLGLVVRDSQTASRVGH